MTVLAETPARLARFATVGVGAALLLFALTYGFARLGLPPFAGTAAAYAFAFVAAYAGQQRWTFGDAHAHRQALPRYLAVQMACGLGAGVVASGSVVMFGATPLVMSALATLAASAASFVLCSLWVFPAQRRTRSDFDIQAALLLAVTAALLALAWQATSGFPTLFDTAGNNDNPMRLVEIRDLLAGQGWFDPTQTRMGLAGGFAMHWSRLVDLPIALIVATSGEVAAALIWPSLLYAASVMLVIQAAMSMHGRAALVPAFIVGAITLYLTGVFTVASFDHHNVQLTLCLGVAAWLVSRSNGIGPAMRAGVAAAMMPAVGLETLPMVAAAGMAVALDLLLDEGGAGKRAAGFGLGFAGGAAAFLLITVPVSRWGAHACDAFSMAQALPAILGGIGLACIAGFDMSRPRRLAAMVGLGAALALVVVVAFTDCLRDPYAAVDPRLRALWLDQVAEAQNAATVFSRDPAGAIGSYVTPLLGLIVLTLGVRTNGFDRARRGIGLMLLVAFAISLWQVRGAVFALPLAVVPLAGWITDWRARATHPGVSRLAAAATWLLSLSFVWATAANAALSTLAPLAPATSDTGSPCYATSAYRALAAEPAATVLAVSNLGPLILAHTGHRVLSGAYHRNNAGNLAALDAWLATPERAEAVLRRDGVGLVAFCAGNPETGFLARKAPDSLIALLSRGDAPPWLEPVPAMEGDAITLFRLRPTTTGG